MMKLVIDIPKRMYLNAKKDMLCGADILVSAIKNGIPYETVTEFADRCRECGREKVLDKIRTEIKQIHGNEFEVWDGHGNRYKYKTIGEAEVLEIIDKYRAESEV